LLGTDHWDVAVTLGKLGEFYFKQGRYNDAEPFLVRVITIRERIFGWRDPAMAKPLTRLAHLYTRQRKHARAEQIVRYALTLFAQTLPSDHPDIIGCLNLLAEVYRGLSRYVDADFVWKVAQGLVDGSEGRQQVVRLQYPHPPRISGPTPQVSET
jgi:tetratricopeptide (TPR) repeat protein